MITSSIGDSVDVLDTPALLVDSHKLSKNIGYMTSVLQKHDVNWRPHSKAHKSPAVAHLQMEAGAIGITCAKTSEAEVYVASGIKDILIANQIVGPLKTRRIANLARHADIKVAVDSLHNVLEHEAAAKEAGTQPTLIIELNCGMDRAGIHPGPEAIELAKRIADLEHVQFGGVMTWEGHTLTINDVNEREKAVRAALAPVLETVESIRNAGIEVGIVSCGGTGTFLTTASIPGITEVQAGGGIFGDRFYRDLDVPVEPALTLLATVVSRPTPNRIIFDAGRKSVDPSNVDPELIGVENVESVSLSAEHGTATLSTSNNDVKIGDRIRLNIGYSDQVVHLHEQMYVLNDDRITGMWPTYARGRLQ